MRARLALVLTAVTAMVTIAFLVPLALLTRDIARDRALDLAERDTRSIAPVLALDPDRSLVAALLGTTVTGAEGRMSIRFVDGTVLGATPADADRVAQAAASGRSSRSDVAGGAQVDTPVVIADGEMVVVSAFVPDARLEAGVASAWLGLGLVGLALIVLAGIVASRLARTLVRPVTRLAEASTRLGAGDLTVRIVPEGPHELVAVAQAFNRLVAQVETLLVAEREGAADLAHRLRTPLTALRIEAEAVADHEQALRIVEAVDRLTVAVNRVISEARRPDRGEPTASTSVSDIVRGRLAYWAPLLEDLERPFSHHVPDGLVAVVDPERLGEAIDLLIENVLQHTPEAAALAVTAGADEWTWVSIADGGPGFPATAVTRGVSGAGSTGLGLDIARHIVTSAGGELSIGRSALGGAEVTLRLGRWPRPPVND